MVHALVVGALLILLLVAGFGVIDSRGRNVVAWAVGVAAFIGLVVVTQGWAAL